MLEVSRLVAGQEVVFSFLARSGKCDHWFLILQMHLEHTNESADYAVPLARGVTRLSAFWWTVR